MIKKIIKKEEQIFEDIKNEYIKIVKEKPDAVLGLATGSSPIKLYEKLIHAYENDQITFENIKTFNLDEYYDLEISNENSYHTFMYKNLFSKVNIKIENTNFPPTEESKIEQYENKLKENPIDVQLLGIGTNGHIAFNEPGSSFDSITRVVDLAQKTIDDNSRFFNSIDEVPKKAVTMGLSDIMNAKKIILIAVGEKKAPILKEIFSDDKVTQEIPATILKNHPDVTFYIDEEAAKFLK